MLDQRGTHYFFVIEEQHVLEKKIKVNDVTETSVVAPNSEKKIILFFQKKSSFQLDNERKINKFRLRIYQYFAIYYLSMVVILSIPMTIVVKKVAKRVTV